MNPFVRLVCVVVLAAFALFARGGEGHVSPHGGPATSHVSDSAHADFDDCCDAGAPCPSGPAHERSGNCDGLCAYVCAPVLPALPVWNPATLAGGIIFAVPRSDEMAGIDHAPPHRPPSMV
ncbi:hypothetical protein [Paludibacterium paludis]|uniref:hypothetical protein n=1 Tax=Paludibacterium paludis TaxID=1225769 RepID=UPI00167AB108|nr:hypothetical protein [Paludibacterium paludis]